MVELNEVYEGELKCRLTHGPSGAKVATDAPKDNGGTGSTFSPTDLLASSLMACATTIAALRLRDDFGVVLGDGDVEMALTKVMSPPDAGPRRVVRLPLTVRVRPQLTQPQRACFVRAVRGCPVKRSLHPSIAVPAQFHWSDGSTDAIDVTACDD